MAVDLDHFRTQLKLLRAELERIDAESAAERAPVTLEQDSVGRLSRIDAMQVQAMALATQRRRQQEMTAIDAALRRIDQGEFGYCLICGDVIAAARLAHSPAVATCIECARGG